MKHVYLFPFFVGTGIVGYEYLFYLVAPFTQFAHYFKIEGDTSVRDGVKLSQGRGLIKFTSYDIREVFIVKFINH